MPSHFFPPGSEYISLSQLDESLKEQSGLPVSTLKRDNRRIPECAGNFISGKLMNDSPAIRPQGPTTGNRLYKKPRVKFIHHIKIIWIRVLKRFYPSVVN